MFVPFLLPGDRKDLIRVEVVVEKRPQRDGGRVRDDVALAPVRADEVRRAAVVHLVTHGEPVLKDGMDSLREMVGQRRRRQRGEPTKRGQAQPASRLRGESGARERERRQRIRKLNAHRVEREILRVPEHVLDERRRERGEREEQQTPRAMAQRDSPKRERDRPQREQGPVDARTRRVTREPVLHCEQQRLQRGVGEPVHNGGRVHLEDERRQQDRRQHKRERRGLARDPAPQHAAVGAQVHQHEEVYGGKIKDGEVIGVERQRLERDRSHPKPGPVFLQRAVVEVRREQHEDGVERVRAEFGGVIQVKRRNRRQQCRRQARRHAPRHAPRKRKHQRHRQSAECAGQHVQQKVGRLRAHAHARQRVDEFVPEKEEERVEGNEPSLFGLEEGQVPVDILQREERRRFVVPDAESAQTVEAQRHCDEDDAGEKCLPPAFSEIGFGVGGFSHPSGNRWECGAF